jgi:hypothetical protein
MVTLKAGVLVLRIASWHDDNLHVPGSMKPTHRQSPVAHESVTHVACRLDGALPCPISRALRMLHVLFFLEHDFTCLFIKKKGWRRNSLHKAPETKPQRKWPKHIQQTERKERRRGDRPSAPIRLDLQRREPTTLRSQHKKWSHSGKAPTKRRRRQSIRPSNTRQRRSVGAQHALNSTCLRGSPSWGLNAHSATPA